MRKEKSESWSRLDNAAKIFPSTVEKSDTRVFRFSCELNESIDEEILQRAAEDAAQSYPNFNVLMKHGFFWYYLEHTDAKIKVTKEDLPVCAALYEEDSKELLYRVSYNLNRINFEVFHVITDGTGALQLLKTIVYRYLIYKYPERFAKDPPLLDDDASFSQKCSDGFSKYYDRKIKKKNEKLIRAFRLRGERIENNGLSVIEGFASVKAVIEAAHKYDTTLTVFLAAVYIKALSAEMSVRTRRYPIIINIPVNLRPYFPSETAKNFFGMISVRYDVAKNGDDISSIVKYVDNVFKTQLTKENLAIRMNTMAALEHNPFVKIAPLTFKNEVLRIARHIRNRGETSVISNVGRIKMPEEFKGLIKRFSVFVSTQNIQLNICSYEDVLQMGFTSSFESTDVQRGFFRELTSLGIDVTVRSNDSYLDTSEGEEAPKCSSAESAE